MSGKLIKAKVTGKPVKAMVPKNGDIEAPAKTKETYHIKKKNRKQDATLINVDALKAQVKNLARKGVYLHDRVKVLENNYQHMRNKLADLMMDVDQIKQTKALTCNSDGKETLAPLIPSVQSQENLAS